MSEKNKQFQIWIQPELKSRLAAAAKQDRRSMNSFVLVAIETACVKVEQQGNNHTGDRKNA
jgi:predicted HicB family RNase H-like nuclease